MTSGEKHNSTLRGRGMEARARYEKIQPLFVWHSNYYDHPLSGVARINGRDWWFTCGYHENWVLLRRMGRAESFRQWVRRTKFGLMVGWHCHYKDGRRFCFFGGRRPKWFFRRLATSYWDGWRGFVKPRF